MNITKYIPAVHDWYVEQGEYKCHGCNGMGSLPRDQDDEMSIEHPTFDCPKCGGTGQHKNIGELLAEIAGLLVGDALRAWKRQLLFSPYIWSRLEFVDFRIEDFQERYRVHCLPLFENQIAQAFIELFDLAGYISFPYCGIIINQAEIYSKQMVVDTNMGSVFFNFCIGELKRIRYAISSKFVPAGNIGEAIGKLIAICNQKNIPIEKHIDARLQYMGVEV